jgi:hypothetical protein
MPKRMIAKILEAARKPRAPRLLEFDSTPAGLVSDRSLRLAFKNEWARIRARHFKENAAACMLCHAVQPPPKIDAHEIYSFPSPQLVRLERLLFVCKHCHDAIHLERTRVHCSPGYIRFVEEHYCKMNGISESDRDFDYKHTIQLSFAIREFYGGAGATPALDFGQYQCGVDATLTRRRKPREDEDDDGGFEMYPDHECPWDVGRAREGS